MISEEVMKRAVYFRGVAHLPINVCCPCNEEDDPEGYWGEDEDGDRVCRSCERELADPLPLEHAPLKSIFEYRLEKSVEIARSRKASTRC